MNFSILKLFGFHDNELQIYKALVMLGKSKVGPIIKGSNVVSSRVYEGLKTLISRGLVSFEVINNIRYYRAEDPSFLLDEIRQTAENIRELADEIKKHQPEKIERNETNTYEGKRAYKQVTLKHVQASASGDNLEIIAYSARIVNLKELMNLYREVDETSVLHKKLNIRMLLDKKMYDEIHKQRKSVIGVYNMRIMPPGYFGSSAVNISKREVLLSVWGDKPTVFSLRNPSVIDSFKKQFEYLWARAKEE